MSINSDGLLQANLLEDSLTLRKTNLERMKKQKLSFKVNVKRVEKIITNDSWNKIKNKVNKSILYFIKCQNNTQALQSITKF